MGLNGWVEITLHRSDFQSYAHPLIIPAVEGIDHELGGAQRSGDVLRARSATLSLLNELRILLVRRVPDLRQLLEVVVLPFFRISVDQPRCAHQGADGVDGEYGEG